jgi:hypothetical protein
MSPAQEILSRRLFLAFAFLFFGVRIIYVPASLVRERALAGEFLAEELPLAVQGVIAGVVALQGPFFFKIFRILDKHFLKRSD